MSTIRIIVIFYVVEISRQFLQLNRSITDGKVISMRKFHAGSLIGIYSNLHKCSISLVCSTRSLRVVWSIVPEIALVEQRLSKCGSADYHKPMRKLHREWIVRHDHQQHNSRITTSGQCFFCIPRSIRESIQFYF